MNGNSLIAMLTGHFKKHKSQARPLLFALQLNGETMFLTAADIGETPQGVIVSLRRVV